jgi:hypothetical protein
MESLPISPSVPLPIKIGISLILSVLPLEVLQHDWLDKLLEL